jgi:hypothetical protein
MGATAAAAIDADQAVPLDRAGTRQRYFIGFFPLAAGAIAVKRRF